MLRYPDGFLLSDALELTARHAHVGMVKRLLSFLLKDKQFTEMLQKVTSVDELMPIIQYVSNLDAMSQMIILGQDTTFEDIVYSGSSYQITNVDGYGYGYEDLLTSINRLYRVSREGFKDPQALTYRNDNDKVYPIGYKITMPQHLNKVKNVIIEVYGGSTKQELNYTGSFSQYANKMKCPVIWLYLPDLLQNQVQFDMSEELHDVIHGCINHFYETISQHPEALHATLAEKGFKDANYFLYGASFGGRTAVRHGQLYPGTFSGYISHDGALAPSPDMPIIGGHRLHAHEQAVLPYYHVKDSIDPMLILHNRDDNNVNMLAALKFYQALKDEGKAGIARLCFFEKGSAATSWNKNNKGHFCPADMTRYLDAITTFMDQGPTAIPEVNELKFKMQSRLAKQFFRDESDTERFLALASQLFYNHQEHWKHLRDDKKAWNSVWERKYKPMLQAIGEIKTMANDPSVWAEHLLELIISGKLTEDVVKNAVKQHAAKFRELISEVEQSDITIEAIYSDPLIVQVFKAKLLNVKSSDSLYLRSFILENLFFSNLSLLPPLEHSKAWKAQEFHDVALACKAAFEKQVLESSHATRKVWTAAAKLAVSRARGESSTVKAATQYRPQPST